MAQPLECLQHGEQQLMFCNGCKAAAGDAQGIRNAHAPADMNRSKNFVGTSFRQRNRNRAVGSASMHLPDSILHSDARNMHVYTVPETKLSFSGVVHALLLEGNAFPYKASRTTCCSFNAPFDVVKSRFQSQLPTDTTYRYTLQSLHTIYQRCGCRT